MSAEYRAAEDGTYGATSPARLSGTMLEMPSNTSACTFPASASAMILAAVGASFARAYCSTIPGYFFSNAAFSGRIAWLTMSVVYQTTVPSFLAASISAASAACATFASDDNATSAARKVRADRRQRFMRGLPADKGFGGSPATEAASIAQRARTPARASPLHIVGSGMPDGATVPVGMKKPHSWQGLT
jgi:hypothetical protein